MKGYFRQLAHQTGLSFKETGQPNSARSPRASHDVATQMQAREHAPLSPPHLEEVIYTSQPTPSAHALPHAVEKEDAEKNSPVARHASDALAPHERNHGAVAKETTQRAMIDLGPQSFTAEARAPESHPESTLESSSLSVRQASEREVNHVLDENHLPAQPSGPQKISQVADIFQSTLEEHISEEGARSDAITGTHIEQKPARLSPEEQAAEADLAVTRTERKASVQHYLKEVLEWVAAPALADKNEPDERRASFPARAEDFESSQGHKKYETEVVEARQQARAREPEVHDLNLSIGTISIVIEEPQAAAGLPSLPPAPAQNTAPSPARSETTSLSRYYLRNF